jgi:hypothetical protein
MVPFLRSSLEELFHSIGKIIIKDDTLSKAHNVELSTENLEDIKLPFVVKDALRKIKRKNDPELIDFQKSCSSFAKNVMLKLREAAPMTKRFIRRSAFLDPDIWKEPEFLPSATKILDIALDEMMKHDWLTGREADMFKEVFLKKIREQAAKSLISSYQDERLDTFWCAIFDDKQSLERRLIDRILTLQHGQASVERGFSVNKEAMEVNQLEDSLIAQRIIYDAIKDEDLREFKISKDLIKDYRNSSRVYKESLAKQKSDKENHDAILRERKRVAQELASKEAEIKRRRLELMDLQDEILVLRKK